MAVDYTVIMAVRQKFGDGTYRFEMADKAEPEVEHVGVAKQFAFSCPNVDPAQMAVLHFESFGLSTYDNWIDINTVPVPGGLKPARVAGFDTAGDPREGTASVRGWDYSFWKAHQLLVDANVLQEENILYIESIEIGETGTLDNFIIDNVVIFFKTRTGGGLGGIRDVNPG